MGSPGVGSDLGSRTKEGSSAHWSGIASVWGVRRVKFGLVGVGRRRLVGDDRDWTNPPESADQIPPRLLLLLR